MADMKFRFAEEEDACACVTRLATHLMFYPPEHVLVGDYLHDDWDPEMVGAASGNRLCWLMLAEVCIQGGIWRWPV